MVNFVNSSSISYWVWPHVGFCIKHLQLARLAKPNSLVLMILNDTFSSSSTLRPHSIYIGVVSSQILFSCGTFQILLGWSGVEIKRTMHVALHKQPTNYCTCTIITLGFYTFNQLQEPFSNQMMARVWQFKLDQQSRQKIVAKNLLS